MPCIVNGKYKNAWFRCISLCQDTIIWGTTSYSKPQAQSQMVRYPHWFVRPCKKKGWCTWMIHIYTYHKDIPECEYIYVYIFQICKISATLGSCLKWISAQILHTKLGRSRYIYIYIKLVGGFNPSETYESKWESSPSRGEHTKIFETTT